MKEFLHSMGGVWPDRELSVISCRQSDIDVPLLFISRLIPKKQLSTASNRRSEKIRLIQAIVKLIPETYHLIPLLILVFVSCGAALAQEPVGHTAPAAQAESKAIDLSTLGVQIGERVPDLTISNIHNYKISTAKLSDFKGKLLILDFWATWCSPCIAMIPKMDSLQKEFGDKVQFLSVTYQREKDVLTFMKALEKKNREEYGIPMVMDDTTLRGLFPHEVLPHYVWIDADQKYLGATETKELTRENISRLIEKSDLALEVKRDTYIEYDDLRPLFIENNGGSPADLITYSLLSKGYQEGLPLRISITGNEDDGIKITGVNQCIMTLFGLAYGGRKKSFDKRNIVLNVRDKDRVITHEVGNNVVKWLRRNGYTYELKVPFHYGDSAFAIMLDDLHAYFKEYKTELTIVRQKQLVMKRTSDLDKLASKGGISNVNSENYNFSMVNLPMHSLVQRLNVVYLQGQELTLIDKTQYEGPIDITLPVDLSNLTELNRALAGYDLVIEEEMNEVEHLIISDK